MLNAKICSNEETNLTVDSLEIKTFSENFQLWVNYSYKKAMLFNRASVWLISKSLYNTIMFTKCIDV